MRSCDPKVCILDCSYSELPPEVNQTYTGVLLNMNCANHENDIRHITNDTVSSDQQLNQIRATRLLRFAKSLQGYFNAVDLIQSTVQPDADERITTVESFIVYFTTCAKEQLKTLIRGDDQKYKYVCG